MLPIGYRPVLYFRVLFTLVALAQAGATAIYVDHFFGPGAIVPAPVPEASRFWIHPNLRWLELFGTGASETAKLVGTVYIIGLVGLLFGCLTRLSAGMACLCHAILLYEGSASFYGTDALVQIGLFYCTVFPVSTPASVDYRLFKFQQKRVGWGYHLLLIQIRIHLVIIYFTSGLTKLQAEQWWNGEALWRTVHHTHFPGLEPRVLMHYSGVLTAMSWFVILLELSAPLLLLVSHFRKTGALLFMLLHLGIAVVLHLYSFAAVIIAFLATLVFESRRRR